jgi:hypothetical protein
MKSRQFLSMVIVLPMLALSVDAAENTTSHTATPTAQRVLPNPTPCSSYTKELLLENKLALASIWANLSNSDQSMKSTIAKALDVADKGLPQASRPMDLCPDSCQLPRRSQRSFCVRPRTTIWTTMRIKRNARPIINTPSRNPSASTTNVFVVLQNSTTGLVISARNEGKKALTSTNGVMVYAVHPTPRLFARRRSNTT